MSHKHRLLAQAHRLFVLLTCLNIHKQHSEFTVKTSEMRHILVCVCVCFFLHSCVNFSSLYNSLINIGLHSPETSLLQRLAF